MEQTSYFWCFLQSERFHELTADSSVHGQVDDRRASVHDGPAELSEHDYPWGRHEEHHGVVGHCGDGVKEADECGLEEHLSGSLGLLALLHLVDEHAVDGVEGAGARDKDPVVDGLDVVPVLQNKKFVISYRAFSLFPRSPVSCTRARWIKDQQSKP